MYCLFHTQHVQLIISHKIVAQLYEISLVAQSDERRNLRAPPLMSPSRDGSVPHATPAEVLAISEHLAILFY